MAQRQVAVSETKQCECFGNFFFIVNQVLNKYVVIVIEFHYVFIHSNTTETLSLLESNLREIRVHKANKRRYFVNNQFVFTPKFQTKEIKGYITGQATLLPVSLAKRGLYNP